MMPATIRIGSKVSALVGPFLELTDEQLHQVSRPRRSRQRLFGTIIKSAPEQRWTVYWEDINRFSDHSSAQLKIESKTSNFSVDTNKIEELLTTPGMHLKTTNELDKFFNSKSSENILYHGNRDSASNNNTALSSHPNPLPNSLETLPCELNAGHSQINNLEGSDINNENDVNNFDENREYINERVMEPSEIINDIIAEENSGLHRQRHLRYETEKLELVGKNIIVGTHSKSVLWKVIDDIKKESVISSQDVVDKNIGIKDFDFQNQNITCPAGKSKRINLLSLIIHLWPGNWETQLKNLNYRISKSNVDLQDKSTVGRCRKMNLISKNEFWIWFGILLAARIEGRKGDMWEKNEPEGYAKKVDLSSFMTRSRFTDIRKWIPFLFADDAKREIDDWWQFSEAVNLYNENRARRIITSMVLVLDESMSAFRPQTKKAGNLPHISYVERKPEDLGTEFKVVADSVIGCCLYLEIQKGSKLMRESELVSPNLKVQAACTARLIKNTKKDNDNQQTSPEIYLGDSWFGSVDVTVYVKKNFGCNFIGVVKNSHSKYPKVFLEKTMAEWPGGSHLVLETTIDGVDVVAVGYKYNKKRVNCFVFSKGSGHTEPGECYEVKWKDDNGNTRHRDVPRPQVVANYYKNSNTIDVFNQSRQHHLRLEKYWITEDGYFRLITTLFGIVVTDAWKGYQHHIHINHRHKGMELESFTNILAKDMLENKYPTTPEVEDAFSILTSNIVDGDIINSSISIDNGNQTTFSPLTTSDSQSLCLSYLQMISETTKKRHTLKRCDDLITHSVHVKNDIRTGKRSKRGLCMICGNKTSFYCSDCPPTHKRVKAWCCIDSIKGNCYTKHVDNIEKGER
jgi:Transposase IS4